MHLPSLISCNTYTCLYTYTCTYNNIQTNLSQEKEVETIHGIFILCNICIKVLFLKRALLAVRIQLTKCPLFYFDLILKITIHAQVCFLDCLEAIFPLVDFTNLDRSLSWNRKLYWILYSLHRFSVFKWLTGYTGWHCSGLNSL